MWDMSAPLKPFSDVTMIVGLGKSNIDDNGWSFVNNAYYQGYLENNMYSF